MISKKKRLEFYQSIFNDEKICPMFLAGLISEEELSLEENREVLSSITKLVTENFEEISFKNEETKHSVKNFFEKVPEILEKSSHSSPS